MSASDASAPAAEGLPSGRPAASAPADSGMRSLVLSTAAVALAWVLFGLVVSDQALVESMLAAVTPSGLAPVLPGPTLAQLTLQHLLIVGVSSGLTILIGLPLGVVVTRRSGADFRAIVSATVDFGQVFPPIAVLALMLPIIGLGLAPAIVALVLYGLFPVVSSTVAGLDNVPPSVIDAARGVGMSGGQVLRKAELPLSAAVIMAGIRTSVIINVGTATVAAATGAGGLGLPIYTGISTQNIGFILEGAITVSALALLLDATLSRAQAWLTPASLRIED